MCYKMSMIEVSLLGAEGEFLCAVQVGNCTVLLNQEVVKAYVTKGSGLTVWLRRGGKEYSGSIEDFDTGKGAEALGLSAQDGDCVRISLAFSVFEEKKIDHLKKLLESSHTDNAKLKGEFLLMRSSYDDVLDEVKMKSEEVVGELKKTFKGTREELQLKISNLNREIKDLKTKIRVKEEDLASGLRTAEGLRGELGGRDQRIKELEGTGKESKPLKHQLTETRKTRKKLKGQVGTLEDALLATNNLLEAEKQAHLDSQEVILCLKHELEQLYLEFSQREKYNPVKLDPIDIALANYINSKQPTLQVPFSRIEFGIYNFGFRRVCIRIEHGGLVVRVGGGFMLIDQFVEQYSPAELEKCLNSEKLVNGTLRNSLEELKTTNKNIQKDAKLAQQSIANSASTLIFIQKSKIFVEQILKNA